MGIVDKEDIIQILKIVGESKIDEFYLKTGDLKLSTKRSAAEKTDHVREGAAVAASPAPATPASAKQTAPVAAPVPEPVETDAEEAGLVPIKASLLGTFYRSPKPGAPPFVEIDQAVNEDDVICIIEVMKLFNSTKAGIAGRIKKVCAKDGELVEFGQTLFLVEPVND